MTWAGIYLATRASSRDRDWLALVFVLPYAATLAVRRRWPIAAAGVAAALLLATGPLGLAPMLDGALGLPLLRAPFLLTYGPGPGPAPAWPPPLRWRPAWRSRTSPST